MPEVGVALVCSQGRVRLAFSQQRHATKGDNVPAQQWQIPVSARYGEGRASRTACTLLLKKKATRCRNDVPGICRLQRRWPRVLHAGLRFDVLARLARHGDALTPAEYANVLYDLRALVRAGSVSSAQALEWASAAAHSRDRHVVVATIALASFVCDELVSDAERTRFSMFVCREFAPRERALGFAPWRGESDDEELLRRSLLVLAAPEDPALAAQASAQVAGQPRGCRCRPRRHRAAARDAHRQCDAVRRRCSPKARRTSNWLDRRNGMISLYAFGDPVLARRVVRRRRAQFCADAGVDRIVQPAVRSGARERWRIPRAVQHGDTVATARH